MHVLTSSSCWHGGRGARPRRDAAPGSPHTATKRQLTTSTTPRCQPGADPNQQGSDTSAAATPMTRRRCWRRRSRWVGCEASKPHADPRISDGAGVVKAAQPRRRRGTDRFGQALGDAALVRRKRCRRRAKGGDHKAGQQEGRNLVTDVGQTLTVIPPTPREPGTPPRWRSLLTIDDGALCDSPSSSRRCLPSRSTHGAAA